MTSTTIAMSAEFLPPVRRIWVGTPPTSRVVSQCWP